MANNRKIFDNKQSNVEKFIYLRSLFDRNVTLAHALFESDISAFMPIIYTPTVAEACSRYSSMFRKANGVFFYPGNIDQAESILAGFTFRDIRVAVVTDNQGILGIGDQGVGGISICLGKLMLYTMGAGIAPWHCLPVSLDVGTDNKTLLEDPNYLGWRHPRLKGNDYSSFIQRFARAFKAVFPNAICQWEDFSKQNAFAIRDLYLHDLVSFNDDIQGTGAITLAALYSAMKLKKEKITEQVFLVHGAGAGGVGIAEQIFSALTEEGLSEKEARRRIFTLDSRGLITSDTASEPYKQKFAHNPSDLAWLSSDEDKTLESVVKKGRVTVLIGTSGQPGCFTEAVVRTMAQHTPQPVIFPLSNPTEKAEALPADLLRWTDGRGLVATGSPFAPVPWHGSLHLIGQCNNVFIFPGIGLGVLASGAREILPSFFSAAARAVSDQVPLKLLRQGSLLPLVEQLRSITAKVALAVGTSAIDRQVAGLCVFSEYQHDNDHKRLATLIDRMRWRPAYLPLAPE